MLISEVIKKLQEILAEHGDLPIYRESDGGTWEVGEVNYSPKDPNWWKPECVDIN